MYEPRLFVSISLVSCISKNKVMTVTHQKATKWAWDPDLGESLYIYSSGLFVRDQSFPNVTSIRESRWSNCLKKTVDFLRPAAANTAMSTTTSALRSLDGWLSSGYMHAFLVRIVHSVRSWRQTVDSVHCCRWVAVSSTLVTFTHPDAEGVNVKETIVNKTDLTFKPGEKLTNIETNSWNQKMDYPYQ